MSTPAYVYTFKRRVTLTPQTPGLVPPQPFVVARVAAGEVVEQGYAFITKPWNGKTPTASLYPMGQRPATLPAQGTPLAQVALGAELGTDVYSDGTWILDRGAGKSYLAGRAEDLAIVIDDGRGAAPGSTVGEVVFVISVTGQQPTP